MVFYIQIGPRAENQIGFLLHAALRPPGLAAWSAVRGVLMLQLARLNRSESGDPLVMSSLGRKVGSSGLFAILFPENVVGLNLLVGAESSQLWKEASHRGWEKAGPDSHIFEMPFTACAGCDYTKADSCVIKCTEMISSNRLWALGFFSR